MTVSHGPHSVVRKCVTSPSPEEQEAAETTCDELTATPIPCAPEQLERSEKKFGVKLNIKRREGWEEGY